MVSWAVVWPQAITGVVAVALSGGLTVTVALAVAADGQPGSV